MANKKTPRKREKRKKRNLSERLYLGLFPDSPKIHAMQR
jgi:hypothetical protein